MRTSSRYLYLGMGASLLIHMAFYCPLVFKDWAQVPTTQNPEYSLVSVQIKTKPPDKPVEVNPQPVKVPQVEKPVFKKKKTKPKPKPIKKEQRQRLSQQKTPKKPKNPLPASIRKTKLESNEKPMIKPVFGASRSSVVNDGGSTTTVRIGNTLMKAQEEQFTPAEDVEDYYAVPPFELSSLPLYKIKVVPVYPDVLKAAELEGQVLMSVTIDNNGKVVALKVIRSDNDLFTKAAKTALKKCEFTPGTQNGVPVTTIIDIPIKFVLDE